MERMRCALRTAIADSAGNDTVTLDRCIESAEHARGRAIKIRAVDLSETLVFGLWVDLPTHDLILVDRYATPAHRGHIIEHELGHILLGHRGTFPGDIEPAPDVMHRGAVLCRQSADAEIEHEAELFARLLRCELHKQQLRRCGSLESDSARRLALSLGYRP
ncbi:hypothetical protein [Nocardia sp. NPDC052566]|uniref:hypothetical protein n=1 Tax=Nocardia sp. NPDC052566 TaxID=3364330 RepID=UPI0037C68F78